LSFKQIKNTKGVTYQWENKFSFSLWPIYSHRFMYFRPIMPVFGDCRQDFRTFETVPNFLAVALTTNVAK